MGILEAKRREEKEKEYSLGSLPKNILSGIFDKEEKRSCQGSSTRKKEDSARDLRPRR